MARWRPAAGALVIWGIAGASGAAADIAVVTTIQPIHSLVSGVMVGVGKPVLLVTGSSSPHTYAMRPSDARSLSKAAVFFRISGNFEPFTRKLVASLPKSVQVVSLVDAPGLRLLPVREGGGFDTHEHAGESHGHGHGKAKAAEVAEDVDGHMWLDPANAAAIVDRVAQVLSERAPEHAATFRSNADAMKKKLEALVTELETSLKPLAGKPYVVFHDAYQYLERRFGLTSAGSVTVKADVAPSGKRLGALRTKIESLKAVCLFSEPQFEPKVLRSLAQGTSARSGILDPLGATTQPGTELYFTMMRSMARSLKDCLGETR